MNELKVIKNYTGSDGLVSYFACINTVFCQAGIDEPAKLTAIGHAGFPCNVDHWVFATYNCTRIVHKILLRFQKCIHTVKLIVYPVVHTCTLFFLNSLALVPHAFSCSLGLFVGYFLGCTR